jgi:hypothetical protein
MTTSNPVRATTSSTAVAATTQYPTLTTLQWYVSGLVGLYVDLASGTATTFIPSYNPSYNTTETDTLINIQCRWFELQRSYLG